MDARARAAATEAELPQKTCWICIILHYWQGKRYFPPWRLCAVASLRWVLHAKPNQDGSSAEWFMSLAEFDARRARTPEWLTAK
jgi:hypothetical protein